LPVGDPARAAGTFFTVAMKNGLPDEGSPLLEIVTGQDRLDRA
jgi:hypothetical protein